MRIMQTYFLPGFPAWDKERNIRCLTSRFICLLNLEYKRDTDSLKGSGHLKPMIKHQRKTSPMFIRIWFEDGSGGKALSILALLAGWADQVCRQVGGQVAVKAFQEGPTQGLYCLDLFWSAHSKQQRRPWNLKMSLCVFSISKRDEPPWYVTWRPEKVSLLLSFIFLFNQESLFSLIWLPTIFCWSNLSRWLFWCSDIKSSSFIVFPLLEPLAVIWVRLRAFSSLHPCSRLIALSVTFNSNPQAGPLASHHPVALRVDKSPLYFLAIITMPSHSERWV